MRAREPRRGNPTSDTDLTPEDADRLGAWVVARKVAGLAAETPAEKLGELWDGLVRTVSDANGAGPRDALVRALDGNPSAEDILQAVFTVDPRSPRPVRSANRPAPTDCPLLPEGARIDGALAADAGAWLDDYIRHARGVSPMTPTLFHESAGLWLAAVAIARRLKVGMSFGEIFANLFGAWVARTTLFHKSTALAVPRAIAREAFPHLLASQEATPEALPADLAGLPPPSLEDLGDDERNAWERERDFAAQRGLLLDELSGLLAGAGRDYNAGLIEALLRFYDCDPLYRRSTRGQGRVTVRNASMSLLGASTPKAMAPHLAADRLWAMGWWPRFALLCPEADRPSWEKPTATGPPTELIGALRRLDGRLPAPKWPEPVEALSIGFGPGVFRRWDAYSEAVSYTLLTDGLDERLWGTYGRLPTQVLNVASILAALDWADKAAAPTIELRHLARAVEIAERWRTSAHRLLAMAARSEASTKLDRVVKQIGRSGPDGATLRDLRRAMTDLDPKELEDLVGRAVRAGEVVEVPAAPGPRGGRPTARYRLATE